MTTTVIETYQVAPPPGAVAEQSMPLAFFDMTWLHFHPMLQILFYEFPCSKQQFLESVVPNLKQSLSLTLKHFLPYSCKIVYPSFSEKLPEFRYLSEDSVPFLVAESSDDFDSLVGSRAISAARYYPFVPKLPPIVEEVDQKVFGVLSVQVTLFPGRGVGIGITKHHSVADAPSVLSFISGWASINKHVGDEELKKPVIDRTVVKYPSKLNSIYWERARRIPLESRHPSLPTDRIRTTFVLSDSDIKKLKGLIQSKVSINISSFVAIAAYIWKGITKITTKVDDEIVVDEELAYFMVLFDLRPRLDPPVPENYFGNCLTYALPRVRLGELVGDEGVFVAAEAIAAEIKKKTNEKRILDGIETRSLEIREAVQKSFFSVAGSSRLDLYGADFGWGKARKQEILSIDGERYAMTMCKARDLQGGVEVCLSLPKDQMEVFDAYISTLKSLES